MDEIKEILESKEFDFDAAFLVFCKYSRSQSLVKFISRKRCVLTLKYQLKRLQTANPKPNPHTSMFAQPMGAAPSTTTVPEGDMEKPLGKYAFARHERLDRDKLPEHVRDLYDKNTQAFKERRSLHEKMKVVETDEARAECRAAILKLSLELRDRWVLIDSELAKVIEGASTVTDDNWKESTCRAYISKKLKKEELSDGDIIDLRERVKQLQDRNLTITDATLAKLKELKVI